MSIKIGVFTRSNSLVHIIIGAPTLNTISNVVLHSFTKINGFDINWLIRIFWMTPIAPPYASF